MAQRLEQGTHNLASYPLTQTEAEKRSVKVIAILDARNRTKNYSAADFLAHEGVETYVDSMHAIAHNKIMIIDGTTVLTGSFNFTKAADQKNAENLLVIRDDKIAAKYEAHFGNVPRFIEHLDFSYSTAP